MMNAAYRTMSLLRCHLRTITATAVLAIGVCLAGAAPRVALGHDGDQPTGSSSVMIDMPFKQYRVLVARVYFKDYASHSPISRYKSPAEFEDRMKWIDKIFQQTSYGKVDLAIRVIDLQALPQTHDEYCEAVEVKLPDGTTRIDWICDRGAIIDDGAALVKDDVLAWKPDAVVVHVAETDTKRGYGAWCCACPKALSAGGACYYTIYSGDDPNDNDGWVWGGIEHELGHAMQRGGPAHPSNYNSDYEVMDRLLPGQTGAFEKQSDMAFPGWLPSDKYVNFAPADGIGPAGTGVGGGSANLYALEYDPAGRVNPQALRAYITDGLYYLVSVRRRVLGDDTCERFTPPGIPDEGVLIERVVEGGNPDINDCPEDRDDDGAPDDLCARWVEVMTAPHPSAGQSLWTRGDTFSRDGVTIEIPTGGTAADPDAYWVEVRYSDADSPDAMLYPWRSAPSNTWETTDIWVDSPLNGYDAYRYGWHKAVDGDNVPQGNGDNPAVDHVNRVYARVRNGGSLAASNVTVRFEITDPPGRGIIGEEGWKALGVANKDTFPSLATLAPGAYADVYVEYTPDVSLRSEHPALLGPREISFHTCLRVKIDPVPGDPVLGNQDGNDEQENIDVYEVIDGSSLGEDKPFKSPAYDETVRLHNNAPVERVFRTSIKNRLTSGWVVEVNGGEPTVTLAAGESRDVPVVIRPPDPISEPPGTVHRVEVQAAYDRMLFGKDAPPEHQWHTEQHVLGGVVIETRVVAPTRLHCDAHRNADGRIDVIGRLEFDSQYYLPQIAVTAEALQKLSKSQIAATMALLPVGQDGRFSGSLVRTSDDPLEVLCLFAGTDKLASAASGFVPVRAPGTGLYIDPALSTVAANGDVTLDVRIADVTDLYGIQFDLTFDRTKVQVVDANPATPTIEVFPGDFLKPNLQVLRNVGNNTRGLVEYAASLQGAQAGVTGGGVIARIRFRGVAAGTSPLEFTRSALSDPQSQAIETQRYGGQISVTAADSESTPFTVSGKLKLERRGQNAGGRVCVGTQCTTTGADGNYQLTGVGAGQRVTATHPSYLASGHQLVPPIEPGGTVTLPDATLLGGDVDQNGQIYDIDAASVAQSWNQAPGEPRWLLARDITDDKRIDIYDMVAVQYNWRQLAPGPWDGDGGALLDAWTMPVRTVAQPAVQKTLIERAIGLLPFGQAQSATVVRLRPAQSKLAGVGSQQTVDIVVESVRRLYLFNIRLRFDPRVLRVLDADPLTEGVQASVSDFLDVENLIIVRNEVDNQTGELSLVVTENYPATGRDGSGKLGSVTFVAAGKGQSSVDFDELRLLDDSFPDPQLIASTGVGAAMNVASDSTLIYMPFSVRTWSTTSSTEAVLLERLRRRASR